MRAIGCAQLIGQSQAISDLQDQIAHIARSDAKVLVTGESGVGKELVAHEIHDQSQRAVRPFVAVNCAGLPDTLLESELFGHVKGSFTGAYRDKPGKLEAAHGGTVFLDEVGEMTVRMQGLLLRFLETGELQKVGEDRSGGVVDVRVISATNRSIRDLVAQGRFREDLYYRLNVIQLVVLPLRDRKDDIPGMVEHFLKKFTGATRSRVESIGPDAMEALIEYSWPGNVRELQNVLERLAVIGRHPIVQLADLPEELRARRAVPVAPARREAPATEASPALSASAVAASTVAEELYRRLIADRESFWTSVYPLYRRREITRSDMRELVRKGLLECRGNYRIMIRLFNMEGEDYKKFLNFLRKHDCQLPFKGYRQVIHQ
jgi:transcriptional regulator with PAS, ATPase and Fis domain